MNSNISDCSCGFCLNPVGQPVPCSDLASHHFECSMVPDHHSQDHIHLATWPHCHLATLPPGHSRSPGNLPLLFLNKVTAQRLGVNSVEGGTKESPAISISNTNQHRSAIAIFSRNLLLYQGNVGPSWVPSTFLSSIKVNTTRNRPGKGQCSDETRQSRRRLM